MTKSVLVLLVSHEANIGDRGTPKKQYKMKIKFPILASPRPVRSPHCPSLKWRQITFGCILFLTHTYIRHTDREPTRTNLRRRPSELLTWNTQTQAHSREEELLLVLVLAKRRSCKRIGSLNTFYYYYRSCYCCCRCCCCWSAALVVVVVLLVCLLFLFRTNFIFSQQRHELKTQVASSCVREQINTTLVIISLLLAANVYSLMGHPVSCCDTTRSSFEGERGA